MDAQEPVRIYSVNNTQQADIIKNFLQSEGIACRVEGEGELALTGLLDFGLLVHAEDADMARKLIDSHLQAAKKQVRHGPPPNEDLSRVNHAAR